MKTSTPEDIRNIFSTIVANPQYGSRKVASQTGIGHSTIDKYRKIAVEAGLAPAAVASLDDEKICTLFGLQSRRAEFVEPDWEEVRKYLDEPHKWGGTMNTEANAWNFLYVKKYFPDYVAGDLPPSCMSERTFERRYSEYLDQAGLSICRHSPAVNLNFGPASMVEIDTIGDRLTYVDSLGVQHQAVIFCGVLKFSGYFYAEAMPSGSGLCWEHATINMFWSWGGLTQVLRTDNDTAICIHGNPSKGTRTKLRPGMKFLVRELGIGVDLCPVRVPEWKGSIERHNSLIQQNLFADPALKEPVAADNLEELNRILSACSLRINSVPRKGGQLSRLEVFRTYEEPHLLPLPLHRPIPRQISLGRVKLNGYVTYLKNFYYAGVDRSGKEILIENLGGKHVKLMDCETYQDIAVYQLDLNRLPPGNHHKAAQFRSEEENIVTRDQKWFETYFATVPGAHDGIDSAVRWLWERYSRTPAVATRLCNVIWSLHEKSPELLEALNQACSMAVKRGLVTDFKSYLHHAYDVLKENVVVAKTETAPLGIVRGGDYYDQLCD